jgi:hypothetical protein
MSLLSPFKDEEDAMRWYYNTHSLPYFNEYYDSDITQEELNQLSNQFQPPPTTYPGPFYPIVEGGIIDPGPVVSKPTFASEGEPFDMKTAEGYEAYLKSLSPAPETTSEPSLLSIAYDSYSGKPYTY